LNVQTEHVSSLKTLQQQLSGNPNEEEPGLLHETEYFYKQAHWLTSRFPEGVYTDVEGLCKVVTQKPWWFGYSRGWYEGDDTLVVETTNFYGDERAGWLDVNGSPYTDALTMTERFRRPTFGTIEIDVTIDDPKAYTQPFTVRVNHRLLVDEEMIEFICNENEKSTDHIERG
jgi:hypothetical protein